MSLFYSFPTWKNLPLLLLKMTFSLRAALGDCAVRFRRWHTVLSNCQFDWELRFQVQTVGIECIDYGSAFRQLYHQPYYDGCQQAASSFVSSNVWYLKHQYYTTIRWERIHIFQYFLCETAVWPPIVDIFYFFVTLSMYISYSWQALGIECLNNIIFFVKKPFCYLWGKCKNSNIKSVVGCHSHGPPFLLSMLWSDWIAIINNFVEVIAILGWSHGEVFDGLWTPRKAGRADNNWVGYIWLMPTFMQLLLMFTGIMYYKTWCNYC